VELVPLVARDPQVELDPLVAPALLEFEEILVQLEQQDELVEQAQLEQLV